MVYTRLSEVDYMKFAVGVIGYGIGKEIDATKKFLDNYYEEIKRNPGHNNWFYDQTSLWEVYQREKKTIKMYQLRDKEHTLETSHNSMIISRRRNQEQTIKQILKSINCPIIDIDFEGIPTMHDY